MTMTATTKLDSMRRPRTIPPSRRHSQGGVTLLEVLIAILIISFGLLGNAGLQSVGMKYNLGAAQRTAATLLANDIADRMRANMAGVNAGNYHNYTSAAVPACLSTAGCTAQQMAQNDTFEWNAAIAAALPSGIGIVCRDSSPNDGTSNASLVAAACQTGGSVNDYAIKIWWLEDRSEANTAHTLRRVSIQFIP